MIWKKNIEFMAPLIYTQCRCWFGVINIQWLDFCLLFCQTYLVISFRHRTGRKSSFIPVLLSKKAQGLKWRTPTCPILWSLYRSSGPDSILGTGYHGNRPYMKNRSTTSPQVSTGNSIMYSVLEKIDSWRR